MNELTNIAKDAGKLTHRNKKKDSEHLNKHAMHLIRLYLMGIDLLESGTINTYRENDRDFLLRIRKGMFQNDDGTYSDDFFALVKDYEEKFAYAKKHSALPKRVDMKRVEEFVMSVNERVVLDGVNG